MASSEGEIEFEEQLREAGNLLLSPPSDIRELSALLDRMESLLANVEQAPSKSVQRALLPSMKALIADELLRHPDTAVRIAVTSCMSEITRITAPDAPYNDEEMREIFQLTVAAFEKLSDMAGRFYTKAVNILDIVAKVRTCLVMLDLECDASIIEMFKTFLQVIRSDHPSAIFSSMERTMTLVIDESEEVSWDLLSTLLDSVRKENQDVSSTSRKLAEEVIANSAAKLKPYLMEAVQSRGIVLDEYADIVSTICKNGDGTQNGTGEHMVTKEPDSTSPKEVCLDVDGIYEPVTNKGTAPTRNEDCSVNDKSSKVLEHCSLSGHPKTTEDREQPESTDEREPPKSTDEPEHLGSTDEQDHPRSTDAREHPKSMDATEPDDLRTFESGIEQESVRKKRGRKPNSLMNPEEGYDHSWICTGRKTPAGPNRRKSQDKGVDQTPSGNSDYKKSAILLKLKMGGEPASSASLKSSLPDASNSKKGRAKKHRSIINEDANPNLLSASNEKRLNVQVEEAAAQSANVGVKKGAEDSSNSKVKRRKRSATKYTDLNLTKEPDERSESKTKQRKRSTEDEVAVGTNEEATPSGRKVSEKEDEILGDLKLKSKQQLDTKARGRNVNDDRSDQTIFRKVSLVSAASDKGIGEASGDKKKRISKAAAKSEETSKRQVKRKRSAGKDMKITSKAEVESSIRDESSSEGTPKTEVKRKTEKEVASETPEVDEHLVGSRVKIWWPLDKMFYEGVIDSYDKIKMKHKIVYADGDVEILNLKRQRWELICSAEERQETEVLKSDASTDTPQQEKVGRKVEPAKEVKQKSSLRRKFSARRSKAKGRKSVGNSADGARIDKPIVDESMNDVSVKDGNSQEDDENSTKDQMNIETQKTDTNSQQTAKETVIKTKGKRRKVRGGESRREGLDNPGEMSKEAKKEGHSDEVETD